jgi:hypothetical protein
VFKTVPKLRDKRKAFGWRQTRKLVSREQFHASSLRENRPRGKMGFRAVAPH